MSSGAASTAAVNSANDAAEPARLIAVVSVGLAITSVLVPLRCYVRLRVMKNFGIDDWFLILAQVGITSIYNAPRADLPDIPDH